MRSLLISTCCALLATSAVAQNDLTSQLQKALHSANQQEALQQGIAIASLLGCTSKTAGKPATDAFYGKIQTVGKQVEAQCKAKNFAGARATVLAELKKDQNEPVVLALNNCYATGKANFDMMAGPKLADSAEMYARWIKDPALAETEMTEGDVCK